MTREAPGDSPASRDAQGPSAPQAAATSATQQAATASAPQPPAAPPAGLRLIELMHGPLARTPISPTLVAINVLVFALMLFFGAGLWHAPNNVQLAWGANFGPATQDGQWWRLATAMFLHFGLLHLSLNMWALWDAGRLVERLFGSPRFLALYLGSGVVGNLLSLIVQGNRAVSGGASGAIFGVYGALLVSLVRERRRIDAYEFRWLFGAAAVFALASLGLGFAITGIDNAAHIGGLVTGALLGLVLARPLAREVPVRPVLRAVAAAVLAMALAVMVTHIPAPTYRLGEERQARAAIRDFLHTDRQIGQRWESILQGDQANQGRSFDELAGRIDDQVAREYDDSFAELSAIDLAPGAPSAAALQRLRDYAKARGDAAHALAEGLRRKDEHQVRDALESMRRAPAEARAAPASAASRAASSPPERSGPAR